MKQKLILLLLIFTLALAVAPAALAKSPAAIPQPAPPATNPLTGLPVVDTANLALPPALVSISNFPASARPQAGLSYAPLVYELYIGEGMTRFLAVFYGDYPSAAAGVDGNQAASDQLAAAPAIGPIRSGRVAYEKIRKLYNGFLVIASGYQGVLANLTQYTNFYGQADSDVNGAMIPVTKLEELAKANGKAIDPASLTGMSFTAAAPTGGKPASAAWLPFSYKNQVIWRYDPASGAYHRFQDNADAKTFTQASDRLNNEPLTFENVIVLFADHERISSTIFDLNIGYIDRAPALLFRDGQVYEIFWTTANGDYEKETGKLRPIRFVDAQGNPFALKPGQTWVETVTPASNVYETVDSQNWYELKTQRQPGSGVWAINFRAP